jgi:mannosyltransferase
MYATRYVAFCAPAAALLIAAGIAALPWKWMQLSAGVLLLALVLPGYIGQRGPYAMDGGSDWRQVSTVVGAHAHPGDTIVFGLASRLSRMPRLAMYSYPSDYRGLRDVELVTRYDRLPGLRDEVAALKTVTAQLSSATTVWVVEPLPSPRSKIPADVATLQKLGFTLTHEFPAHRNGVYELTRKTP